MINYVIEDYLKLLEDAGLTVSFRLFGREKTPVTGLTYESGKSASGTLFVCKGGSL